MNQKKILFLSFFYLMLISYFPLHSYADTTSSILDTGKYIEIINNTDVFNSDQNVVAEMNIGTQISVESIQDGKVYFQWNGALAYVNEESTKQIGTADLTFTPIDPSTITGQTSGKIVTGSSVDVYSDQNFTQAMLTLNPSVEYSAAKGAGDYYTITLGQRLGYIKASENVTFSQSNTSTATEITSSSTTASTIKATAVTTSTATTSTTTTSTATNAAATATAPQFTAADRYFEVEDNFVSIYDNSGGTLKNVGYLTKGQVYPRVADYGDWHQIKFGNGYGFIWKASTVPATNSSIKDLNTGLPNSNNYFIPTETLTVYDNTSGSLVPFASLAAGIKYPYISDMGDWYQVDVSGRIGYVYKPATTRPFLPADQYFKVTADSVSIYDNSSGTLKQVGYLIKGQAYKRVADYGDWHQIKYGNGYGYIWRDSTTPADKSMVSNLNPGLANSNTTFIPLDQLTVYDNSTGQLVPFASLNKGASYPFISDMGDWYQVDVSGRIGYVYKPATKQAFKPTDKYFRADTDNISVYENKNGSLVLDGYLTKGQVYPRVADYGDWNEIKYGRGYAFVWKDATSPADGIAIDNLSPYTTIGATNFQTNTDVTVYDNTSGSLVPFGTLKSGVIYPYIETAGDWVKVDFSGRVGWIYKGAVQIGPIEVYTNYSKTFDAEVTAQVNLLSPVSQTDKKYRTYVRQDALSVDNPNSPTAGTVLTAGWKVRGGPADSYWVVGTLNQGEQVSILSKVWDAQSNMYWYEIKYNRTWVNASPDDIRYYMDPNNDTSGAGKEFQFLRLSSSAGTNVDEVNSKILANKGILTNQAQAFIDAAAKYKINEVYLMAHSFLETGNGTSVLANGTLVSTIWDSASQSFISVQPKVVYNMFGIGAVDKCANSCGAEYAYTQGWFTPQLAVDGGAKWIADHYTNKGQDTLYKMRWNPAAPATHQYSSDIGWTYKIESNMKQIYGQLLNTNILTFDFPIFN